jgi:glutamate synthase (ferredoxin)
VTTRTRQMTLLDAPARERDACGIGLVADARGRASRELLDRALAGLAAVSHRGAWAADGVTGDGAGILIPLTAALTDAPGAGLAMVFSRQPGTRVLVENACRAEGLDPVGWRDVPVVSAALGSSAVASMPRIGQLRLAPSSHPDSEFRAHRARRRLEQFRDVLYVASLSFRTITYKALCAATQLDAFYPDLRDPELAVSFAIFHQRFSTNTEPSWERAQPFRLLCHNGEINTIEGNIAWMEARERARGEADEIGPAIDHTGSDSAILDNALELLVRQGRDVNEAVTMLVPPAWQNDPRIEDAERAMHRYHALLVEPWDGPAGLVYTDGHSVGAALDRNGLRPLRVAVTDDGLVAVSSEAGAIPLPEGTGIRRARLGPGQLLTVDSARGLRLDAALKRDLARRRPYAEWVAASVDRRDAGVPGPGGGADLTARQALHGYTREELSLMLRPIAQSGHDPVYSMGDDAPLAPLAGRARPLASYLRQRFAQVTNPAIDHLRERTVMSVSTLLGPRAPLDAEGPLPLLAVLPGFLLNPSGLDALAPSRVDATFDAAEGITAALDRIVAAAEALAGSGETIVCISDAGAGGDRAAVPSLLALAATHAHLVELGLRTACSLVVESDEPRDTHMVATLLGFGADAICPRLALETVAALAAGDKIGGDRPEPEEAQRRLLAALEEGVLKVMSKMGIADVASYRGARLFDAIGLDRLLCERFFGGTPSAVGGIGLERLGSQALDRLAASKHEKPELENPGFYKFRKGGEPHATSPEVVEALQASVAAAHALRGAAKTGRSELYDRFAALVNEREPIELRDLLELVPAGPPVPIDEVEPADAIFVRFSGGAMSHGSLSREAHETIAIALNRLGGKSNCGEGGEARDRYGDERNSKIKQIASARFGVTAEYASSAEELQIKVAQGSKPGEGGQIPAHKVSDEIADLRNTQPGVSLISPPPHHDIYSIEDLAQLIFDLHEVNPAADISVKLVSERGVGLVAVGVAKAHADIVHVAGADGGTGASPLPSIKHAGGPWELGVAETQQALVASGLRSRVRIRVDGGLKTGRDVLVAALLGADEFSFGTALLLAEGCLMVRSCHLDTCPVGIATQKPELRAKYAGTPEMVEAYLRFVAEEVRSLLASIGLRSLDEAIGHVECLRQRRTGDSSADSLDLKPLLARAGDGAHRHSGDQVSRAGDRLGSLLAATGRAVVDETRLVELGYSITSADRAVGARLGGQIASALGSGTPAGRVRARFEGSAGQSFGAFLTAGVELDLTGEANDYVGKSMSGGRIVIAPPAGDAGDPCLAGNTLLYGATGGELFCAGSAGERFAVRNSGAVAVVEGVGDHACEYMTRGTVVVLGSHGRNVGAGMTGGEGFFLDVDERLVNEELVALVELEAEDEERLLRLLERHRRATGSTRAAALLADPKAALRRFSRLVPKTEAAALRADLRGIRTGVSA